MPILEESLQNRIKWVQDVLVHIYVSNCSFLGISPSGKQYEEEGSGRRKRHLFIR